jgi:glycosyltransferase involved in cell wall biosynthesis
MPKISVNILTKNRAELLKKALASVANQSFKDFEVIVVDDGSLDATQEVIQAFKQLNIKTIKHQKSLGITRSRQEALEFSTGEYIAILDDDDEWIDPDKLKKQAKFLDVHSDYVLAGGGIVTESRNQKVESIMRPEHNTAIKQSMLLRNNFFTSTVMFRKSKAIKAGEFIKDNTDLAEDYDLWLRLGLLGKVYNFQQPFTKYTYPSYNKAKFKEFLKKQLVLIKAHKKDYPLYWLSSSVLRLRIFLGR